MLHAIKDGYLSYYNQIPADTLPAIGRSAIYSFTFSFITVRSRAPTMDLTTCLVSAGYAALASTIHALTTPIFNYMFGNQDVYFLQEAAKCWINISLSLTLVSYITTKQINFVAMKYFFGASLVSLTAYFDLFPKALNYLGQQFHDPSLIAGAQKIRDVLKTLGLDSQAGVNAVYLLRI